MIDLQNMSILIADDVENMCKSIRNMLKIIKFGGEFTFAYNGREAWEILNRSGIDLAIIDLKMPIVDGIELLERIRGNKILRDMPVIMITAEATSEMVAKAAESDIDAYLLKPITVKVLGEKIASVVEKSNNPSTMDTYLKTARMFEEFGDIDAAIEETRAAIKAEPASSKPIRMLGYYHFVKKDFQNARKYFLEAARMNHLDVFAFHYLGETFLELGDLDKACTFFDKAMKISPRNVLRGIHFGKALVRKNNTDKARGIFDKVISISSDPLQRMEEISDFCFHNGMLEYAAELLAIISEKHPDRHDIALRVSSIYEMLQDWERALGALCQAEKHMPENIKIKMRIARIHLLNRQVILADNVLKSILAIDPDNAEARALFNSNI